MFLSFLVPLPGTMDGLLVVHYGGTFGESVIMQFPEDKPAFKNDNEVMIGFAAPVTKTGWAFTLVGAGELMVEDAPDEPALRFFVDMLAALDRGTTDEREDASRIIAEYIMQTKEFFLDGVDSSDFSASELSTDAARAAIAQFRSTMH